ncbi:hypothetical protein [Halomonas sp. BC04]|uniref:hypothetical protein n=1 Tax=Halomonas sp. BC04 TaxID=1403540 RepID=UPI0003ED801A|nr:hypothetical protein [Halomonas sp. BC04]EWG99926.1 hypothetical protein Q427_22220 [Halomonas sp. BC04]
MPNVTTLTKKNYIIEKNCHHLRVGTSARDELKETRPDIPTQSRLPDESNLDFPPLTRLDLAELSDNEHKNAWERRPASFASLEAACGTLRILLALAGIADDTGWRHLMTHSEILKLADDLPDCDVEDEESPPDRIVASGSPSPSADSLRHDLLNRRKQDIVDQQGRAEATSRHVTAPGCSLSSAGVACRVGLSQPLPIVG